MKSSEIAYRFELAVRYVNNEAESGLDRSDHFLYFLSFLSGLFVAAAKSGDTDAIRVHNAIATVIGRPEWIDKIICVGEPE